MQNYERARSTVQVTLRLMQLHNTENTDFMLLLLVHFGVAVWVWNLVSDIKGWA
jgi:hypothetical protein